MMTSSNGNISTLLAICAGNSPVPGELPAQRTRSFDVFSDLRLNKWLSKQSWGWWFETLSCPLWRHYNVISIHIPGSWPQHQLGSTSWNVNDTRFYWPERSGVSKHLCYFRPIETHILYFKQNILSAPVKWKSDLTDYWIKSGVMEGCPYDSPHHI